MLMLAPTPCSSRRVPIYGTCDAGRGFWKKLRHDILSTGLKENAVIRALYIYQEDGEPKSHACDPR